MVSIEVYPYLSPRVIVIPAPDTEITVQQLHNLIRDWEDSDSGMSFDYLIDSAGKENLGGGVSVGITSTLQNAQIRFAARPVPLSSGTATSAGTKGETLTDTGADFSADGIYPGCTVVNSTTGAMETVITVGTTSLTSFSLQAGTRQDWQIGDEYDVFPNEQCSITGGNLVAIDENGDNISPVLQAPNVQVVRSSSSSATVADLDAIQYSSYQNAIWVDINTSNTGTDYPIGTREFPVNNLADAVQIANERGFRTLQILESMLIDSGTDIQSFRLVGQNSVQTEIELSDAVDCRDVTIENCSITGILDGGVQIRNCIVRDISYVNGHIHDSGLEGTVLLDGAEDALIANCYASSTVLPTIDMGGFGQNLSVVNYTGRIQLNNSLSPGNVAALGLNSGQVIINTDFTAGVIIISGIGAVINNGTPTVLSTEGLMSKETISEAVLNTELAGFTVDATVASSLRFGSYGNVITVDADNGSPGTSYPIGTFESPVDNVQDAAVLAAGLGIHTISFLSNYVFDNTVDVTGLHLTGHGMTDTHFTFEPGAKTFNCELLEAECTGVVDGVVAYYDCFLNSLEEAGSTPYDGRILVKDCLIHGDFKSPSNFSGVLQVLDCWSGTPGDTTPALDLNSNTANMAIRNYAGGLRLKNCTNPTQNSVAFSSGRLILDSSNTDGYFTVRGICAVVDELTGSAVLDTSALLNKELVSEAVWDETLANHTIADSTGEALLGITYDNRIFIDTVNGSAGTVHPVGTKKVPVDNFADALTLSTAYSINRFHIIGSLSISGGEDLSGYTFGADRSTGNVLIASNVVTDFTYIEDLTVIMAQSGSARYTTSVLVDIDDFDGGAKDCLLVGDINVVGSGSNYFTNCDTYVTDDSVPVSIAVNDKKLNLIRGRGNYKITDKTGGPTTSIDLVAGYIEVDSTCTAGSIYISGVCDVIDNSGPGCTVVVRAIGNDSISDTVWDETRSSHNTAGTFGATDEWASAVDTDAVADAVWDEVRAGHVAAGTFGATDEWASAVDVESIADAVWEEPADEHEDVNTMGEKQNTGGTGSGDPEAIADAVWDEASDDHVDDGTMGQLQKKIDTLVAAKPKIVPGE